MMPYGNIELGHHWLGICLVAWRHQAITWTNVDFSLVTFCEIHLTTISHQVAILYNDFENYILKIIIPSLRGQ